MEHLYKKEKLKRYVTIGAAGIVLSILAWIVLGFGDDKKNQETTQVADVEVIEKETTLNESIRAKFSEELTALKEQNKSLQEELNSLAKNNENMVKKGDAENKQLIEKNKADGDRKMNDILEQLKLDKPSDKDNLSEQANLIPPPPISNSNNVTNNKSTDYNPYAYGSGSNGQNAASPVVTVMTGLVSVGNTPLQAEPEKKTDKKKINKKDLIVPAGSFVRAQLASGVIAPTGGQGATDPVPALLRVTGLTQLPNFHKADIKNCFLLAETKGNLATETVNFRLKTLTCKRADGSTLEREVSGYVTGENGMEGMAGRVVSKQGAVIARAFLAEFASGIGDAFESSGTTTSITGAGIIETLDPSKTAQTGLASGLSEAFSRLGDFYMDLAEQMVPVIEINAGRNVDVVFIKSVNLEETEEEQQAYDEKVKKAEERENGGRK